MHSTLQLIEVPRIVYAGVWNIQDDTFSSTLPVSDKNKKWAQFEHFLSFLVHNVP